MKYIKGFFLFLLFIIIMILIYFGAMKIIKKVAYPTLFGYGNAIVISGSMEPNISVNDLVITKKQASYNKGEVILFHSTTALVTHRIVEVKKNRYLTKGDANNTVDEWLDKSRIEGKVVFVIPAVGFIQEFFSTKLGNIGLMLLICFAIIFAFDDDKTLKTEQRPESAKTRRH
jgi:signal peptidase